MNLNTSSFLVLQICICSVPVHGKMRSHDSVREKTLNVKGAFSSVMCFGSFVHLADEQDLIFIIFPSSIVNILSFVTRTSCILPFTIFFSFLFYCMLNKLLLWIIYIYYNGCTVLDALFCFVSFFWIKLFLKINKQINTKVVWQIVFAHRIFASVFFFTFNKHWGQQLASIELWRDKN